MNGKMDAINPPTIIEAARAMYEGHSIEEISRSEAGAQNLSFTNQYVQEVIKSAQQSGHKAICFVTGVPGSGKTLAGLNIATETIKVLKISLERSFYPATGRWLTYCRRRWLGTKSNNSVKMMK